MDGITRRAFLLLTGGAGAAASLEPGRKFVNKLIPYLNQPKTIIPGESTWFATTCRECPAGCGMLLSHRDGRVIKAEGNPNHPVNHGGLCPRGQSALQGLYDPDRLSKIIRRSQGKVSAATWDEAFDSLGTRLREHKGRLIVVSRPETGSLHEVLTSFTETFGGKLIYHDRLAPEPLLKANEAIYGERFAPFYNIAKSDYLLSFGADFLETWISPVRFAYEFAEAKSRQDKPLQHVFIGSRFSMTAASADRFVSAPSEARRDIAGAVLSVLLESGKARNQLSPAIREKVRNYHLPGNLPENLAVELAEELASAERPLVLPGPALPNSAAETELAVIVTLTNVALGNPGADLSRRETVGKSVSAGSLVTSLQGLTAQDTVIILDSNIAFTSPETVPLLRNAGMLFYAGTLPDETAEQAHWVLPLDYPLETWGDYEASTGIQSLLQPVMNRLYDSLSAGDLLLKIATLTGKPLSRKGLALHSFDDWIKSRWRDIQARISPEIDFDTFWARSLGTGFVTETAVAVPPMLRFDAVARHIAASAARHDKLTLVPFSTVLLYDGRTANRGWIQEAPDPLTTAVWDGWAEIHPITAKGLGVKDNDVVELVTSRGSAQFPVIITDGSHEKTVGLLIGQGHSAPGMKTAAGVGANAFTLLTETDGEPVTVRRTGKKGSLVRASATDRQHRRKILQWLSANVLHRIKPGEGDRIRLPMKNGYERDKDTWSGHDHSGHRWGMVIDLNRCIGCGACAIACYAENNIPVVGKKGAAKERELAWLKVTPYRDEEGNRVGWLPVLCQHCDAAPCEPVCPVYASVHNEEGLNSQIYNRCIGTRYCANNCPYKVRRFNWFEPKWRYPLDLQLNPDLTVRSRGVMEKCTFCVQRIRAVELKAAREGRSVRDGEVQTACSQSCPTRAIMFGDLMNPEAKVLKMMKEDPRRYQLLEKLNTKPAVVYLKRVVVDTMVKG